MRQNPPILQLLPIFRYFTRKLCVALTSVDVKKKTRKNYPNLPLLSNQSGKTTCSNMLITQFALQIEYRVEYYVKDLFKDNEQFKTLQEFSDVLSRKSNWLCEYKIL